MMDIKLPKKPEGSEDILQNVRSIVILGANGAGKTRMGSWLEQQNLRVAHRISAQKSLAMPAEVRPKSKENAELEFFYGHSSSQPRQWLEGEGRKAYRWGKKPNTHLLNDYDNLMVLLHTEEYEESVKFKDHYTPGENSPKPITKLDRVQQVWEKLLPHRKLVKRAGVIEVIPATGDAAGIYNAMEMSDGERVIFYLIGEIVCAKQNSIIIIDEPEMHIHKSLTKKLWDEIEQLRSDCVFVYLTHDIDFTVSRANCVKIWVKGFAGNDTWEYELINPLEKIPEQVYLELLGSRQPIIFTEGDNSSWDYQLYQVLFPDKTIYPLGGCSKVLEATKAFNSNTGLHHATVQGIIDRDRRSDEDIRKMEQNGVTVLKAAEVENLFLLESVIKLVAGYMHKDPGSVFQTVKDKIIDLFRSELEAQATLNITHHLKRMIIDKFSLKANNFAELQSAYSDAVSSINLENMRTETVRQFEELITGGDYARILKVYNHKGLICVSGVATLCDILPQRYISQVLGLLKQPSPEVDAVKEDLKTWIL